MQLLVNSRSIKIIKMNWSTWHILRSRPKSHEHVKTNSRRGKQTKPVELQNLPQEKQKTLI